MRDPVTVAGVPEMTSAQVRAYRVAAQQLGRPSGSPEQTAVLDLGVQDTGPDGGRWALALRGLSSVESSELVLLWTLRGAPHLYRRADLASVAAAVAPFSDDDAGKRLYDGSRPLRAAGITPLQALDAVAEALRATVTAPMSKGEVSGRLTQLLPEPYLRDCRPCGTRHVFEQTFRLAAVRAGLELRPGTSPPVLQPVAQLRPAASAQPQHDVVRGYLRLLGPATPQAVAQFLDAPVKDVRSRWPQDAVPVRVQGEQRWLLTPPGDAAEPPGVLLLGPYDLFLQARDRSVLVPEPGRAKALWPVLGRPGAVLADGAVVGLWRPRGQGRRLRVAVELWSAVDRAQLEQQAERLAAHRGVQLVGVDVA